MWLNIYEQQGITEGIFVLLAFFIPPAKGSTRSAQFDINQLSAAAATCLVQPPSWRAWHVQLVCVRVNQALVSV